MSNLHERCAALIEELGIASKGAVSAVVPLTGGVASDIARVDIGDRSLCVKFALPKLKVSADWRAPVHRNAAEYAWLEVAAAVCPEAAIKLFGRSATQHGFAMEFLDGPDVYLWKSALLNEAASRDEASLIGDMLGRIHAASAVEDFDRSAFHNRDDFRALRIEPYLTFTAQAHPQIAPTLNDLAEMLYVSDHILVHGDVSPKNIVFRSVGPVLLDAECATMGDASFDPSFCVNHLVLKAIHLPGSRDRLLADIGRFWTSYGAHIRWETPRDLETRICRLVPALMLGRIDGKSPVEYLNDREQDCVRRLAIELISTPVPTLSELATRIDTYLKERVT